MKQKTIREISERLKTGPVDEDLLEQLRADKRKGVHKLIATYEGKLKQHAALEADFRKMSRFEQQGYAQGYQLIAGVDEAGRGPLAGPVVAAAVVLPPDFKLLGLTDSKLLSDKKREAFYEVITEQAVSYEVTLISNEQIDALNILQATKLAMKTAIKKLDPAPDHILIDAVELASLPVSSEVIIKGDFKSISIAAASILAKVTRDRYMQAIDATHPGYGFKTNMGYGTKEHLHALARQGITPYHRKSFTPVRNNM